MSVKKGLLISFVVVFLVGGVALTANASHSWGNYHWARTTASFDLQLLNSMSGQWQSSLSSAITDWNLSAVLDLIPVAGGGKRSCRGQDGKVEACNAEYGNNGWLGIAQIWASGSHITKGVVKMNDTYYNTATYNTPAWRNLVVCQEIGHTFGLGHQDETFDNPNLNTCMDYTSDPASNQHPNAHDYDMLETIYAHLDSFDSYATGGDSGGGNGKGGGKGKPANVGKDIDLSNPSAWGEVVRRDAQNNPSLYRRDLGNDEAVFTHVYWADDSESH